MKKGFTLIELMVVVGIMALLYAIILPSIDKIRARSRDSRRIADVSQLRLAVEHYFNVYNKYPVDINDDTKNSPAFISSGSVLSSVPTDPKSGSGYFYASYCPSGTATGFHLGAGLEQPNDQLNGDADGVQGARVLCSGTTDFDGVDTASGCGGGSGCYDFQE